MATIADELNAISVEHGYTGAAPKTIAGAIDALADTLAGTDVEERRTIAGAVKALAPYIGGGGGGSLGELQAPIMYVGDRPAVGGFPTAGTILGVKSVKLGSNYVISSFEHPFFDAACAAGATVTLHDNQLGNSSAIPVAYACTLDGDGNYATVREIDLDETVDTESKTMTFVMPSLVINEDEEYWESLYIYYDIE